MSLSDLPAVNACLNALSTIFLTLGFLFIKRGRQVAHRNCMAAALLTSTLFLACYLFYHYNAGRTTFRDPQWFRPYYLLLLLTHTVLAVIIVPMVLLTVTPALRQRWDSHKRIARWTWPIWMYVSVTGVLIYLLLYQVFPQQPENDMPVKAASSRSAHFNRLEGPFFLRFYAFCTLDSLSPQVTVPALLEMESNLAAGERLGRLLQPREDVISA